MSGTAQPPVRGAEPVERLLHRLRQDGFSITNEDFARVRHIHVLQDVWLRGALRRVLKACVVRAPDSDEIFANAFNEVFGTGPDDVQVFPRIAEQKAEIIPVTGFPTATGKVGTGVVERPRRPSPPPVAGRRPPNRRIQLGLVLFAGCAALVGLTGYGRIKQIASAGPRHFDPEACVLGLAAAVLITGVAAFAFHLYLRLTIEEAEVRRARYRPAAAPAPTLGGPPFRVGLIGADIPGPQALDRRRGRQIAELLTYLDTGPDAYRFDILASVRRRASQPHETGLVHARRRVLPEVVLLCDTACPGPRWNTLAAETRTLFQERGLVVETIEVDGSFHRGTSGGVAFDTAQIRTLLADLEDAPHRVVLVFTDGARMHAQDLAVLRRLRKAGPVLWMDYCDRHLWDLRHAAIEAAGIGVWQATQEEMEAALRAIYAPRASRTAWQPWQHPAGRSVNLRRQVWQILGEAADWAADCALLQPMSLPLANRIREELHPWLPWHAFSRLLALPGSSLAAEGVRFGVDTVAILRQRFALRRSPAMQARLTGLLHDVLDRHRPSPGTYAEAAWTWTRLQVDVFTTPDTALPAIERLRDSDVLDRAALDSLLDRIRRGRANDGAPPSLLYDEILLPVAPLSVAALRVLDPERKAAPPVTWQVGDILLRDDLPPADGQAAFFAAGEVFGRIVRRAERPDTIVVTDISTGQVEEFADEESAGLRLLAGAGRPERLVALTDDGTLLVLDRGAEGYAKQVRRLRGFGSDRPPGQHLAVSSDGKWAAAVANGRMVLHDLEADLPEPEAGTELVYAVDGLSAVCAAGRLGFLGGFEDGRLQLFAIPASRPAPDPEPQVDSAGAPVDVVLPGKVTALSVFDTLAPTVRAVVASGRALHVVTLGTVPGVDRTIDLGWDATLAEAFADGVTVAVSSARRFDIIDAQRGLSAWDRGSAEDREPQNVCALSDDGRRFALQETAQRLEIRTLRKVARPAAQPPVVTQPGKRAEA